MSKLHSLLKNLKKDDILKLATKTCEHGHALLSHAECLRKYLGHQEKVGILDIESTGLTASYSHILSYCIKEYDGPVIKNCITTKEIRSLDKDKRLLTDLCADMKKFDRLITFYGTGFDIPYIRSRALLWGLDFPLAKEVKHTDLYYVVKFKLKLHSNGLAAACEYFDIPSKGHRMSPKIWSGAVVGDPKSLEWVVTHNTEDVESTELLYKKLENHFQLNNRSV